MHSLGMILYRILMDKFPFSVHDVSKLGNHHEKIEKYLQHIWVVDTEYFVRQGGMITKLLANLLLKCFHVNVEKRPFVEWILVILCDVKANL